MTCEIETRKRPGQVETQVGSQCLMSLQLGLSPAIGYGQACDHEPTLTCTLQNQLRFIKPEAMKE